jgi:hypothetical protein
MAEDGSTAIAGSLNSKKVGGSGDSGGEAFVQRVVSEVSLRPANWPLITKECYTKWALIMKIKM